MLQKAERIVHLIKKKLTGNLQPAEQAELQQWLDGSEQGRRIMQELETNPSAQRYIEDLLQFSRDKAWKKLISSTRSSGKKRLAVSLRLAAAAVILVLIGLSAYYFLLSGRRTITTTPQIAKEDLPPGSDKAILTLSDGSKVMLDFASTKQLADQHTTITSRDGQLIYTTNTNKSQGTLYNTVTTPRGGKYQLTLHDGTKVWLNAASSIRFPTTFDGAGRVVEITGEAYFDVQKQKNKVPFTVKARGIDILVLGTRFNISAYENEPITTTLLEGSVKISDSASDVTLTPGKKATHENAKFTISPADTAVAIAWKKDIIHFNDSFDLLMRKISRWYDVDVIVNGTFRDSSRVIGEVSRRENLAVVLEVLGFAYQHQLTFELENKQIIVTPK